MTGYPCKPLIALPLPVPAAESLWINLIIERCSHVNILWPCPLGKVKDPYAEADRERDKENITNSPRACFIESVWITPSVRRRGLGALLVRYLIEIQRAKGIQDFHLWVFDKNRPAIELYERLGFRPTGLAHVLDKSVHRSRIREIQYVRVFDRASSGDSGTALDALERDLLSYGVSYRLLG